MTTDEFRISWVEKFNAAGVNVTKDEDQDNLLTGECRVEGESDAYRLVIKETHDFVAIYMFTRYRANGSGQMFELLSSINSRLYKGCFVVQPQTKRILFKYLLPVSAFSNDGFYREMGVLSVAMVCKYSPCFEKILSGGTILDALNSCRGGW